MHKFKLLLADSGGLSRLTIFNDRWHSKHPYAAKLLWGYETWVEAKLYVDAYFEGEVDVASDPSQQIQIDRDGLMTLPELCPFERCMLCRLFFHCFTQQQVIALCFDRHRTRIGQILREWAPKWANVGDALSCLDITADYLHKEVPEKNIELGRPKLVFVDGKDWACSTKQNDTALAKSTYSPKTDEDAARCLTFSTAAGLIFEKSPLFGARAGERKIVQFLSSLGPVNAKTEEWEDVAQRDPWDCKKDDTYWTALDDILSPQEFDEVLQKINDGDPIVENGALDDGVLLTGEVSALLNAGISLPKDVSDAETDDDSDCGATGAYCNDPSSEQKRGRDVFGMEHMFSHYGMMVKCKIVDDEQRKLGKRKRAPILTADTLKEQVSKAIRNDPNNCGKRKLRQLEILQRLHVLYENGELRKCLLSYFLLVTVKDRMALLSWMGSDLAKDVPKPSLQEVPKIPLRLAKIAEDIGVGADKGFTDIKWMLPNLNEEDLPVTLKNSKTQRLSSEQITSEVPITTCRAPCETVFARVDDESILDEKIPYWIIPFLPPGHVLAHGEANLCQPLRYPGRHSIVGKDYWEGVVNYTRIRQQYIPPKNVEVSVKRSCTQCKQGGIVRICGKCNNFYHISNCHDFVNCVPPQIVNPYK